MFVFIVFMLYNDGREFLKQELWELCGVIFVNVIVFVFIIIIFGGFLIYVLILMILFVVGIVLVVILLLIDLIVVQLILEGVKLFKEILYLVSGESLINDVSGLIGFKYVLVVVVIGMFVFGEVVGDFFYISLVGLVVGLVLIMII